MTTPTSACITSPKNAAIDFTQVLADAITQRQDFFAYATQHNTDCYRVFHGTVEGANGLNIDRYGDAWLVQSFHETLSELQLAQISQVLIQHGDFPVVYNDRSQKNSRVANSLLNEAQDYAMSEQVMHENGIAFTTKLRHEGQDPLLFLDMRVGREYVRQHSNNKTVLNLFSYTCGIGTAAAVGGAKRVMNVDFSSFALAAGKKNAELNHVENVCEFVQSDAFPALRQLAGLPVGGRRNQKLPKFPKLAKTTFDLVFLDPPRFAKSVFGVVDLINDYQGLFKPAMLTTKPGGTIVCCNNVAKVERQSWLDSLIRCVEKNGRQISHIEWLDCHQDFPSFDDNHPLKIVALTIN